MLFSRMSFGRMNEKPLMSPVSQSDLFVLECPTVSSMNLLVDDCHVTVTAVDGNSSSTPQQGFAWGVDPGGGKK